MQKEKISPLFYWGLGGVAGFLVLVVTYQSQSKALARVTELALGGIVTAFLIKGDQRPIRRNSSPDDEPELEPEFVPLPPPLPPFTPMAERELEMVEVEYFQPAPLKAMEMEFEDDRK